MLVLIKPTEYPELFFGTIEIRRGLVQSIFCSWFFPFILFYFFFFALFIDLRWINDSRSTFFRLTKRYIQFEVKCFAIQEQNTTSVDKWDAQGQFYVYTQ